MLATETNQTYNTMQTKYDCKELIVKSFYDPVLSSQMIEFLYHYLNRKRNIVITNFSFNDMEKFIDITFDMERSVVRDFNAIAHMINEGFKNLYRQWALGSDFYRLWIIDSNKADEFKDIVINDIESISSNYFTLYSSILFMGSDNLNNMIIRIKLV